MKKENKKICHWKKECVRKLIKWFATAVVYILYFMQWKKGLDYLEEVCDRDNGKFQIKCDSGGLLRYYLFWCTWFLDF